MPGVVGDAGVDIGKVVRTLRRAVPRWKTPAVTVQAQGRDPFRVLVSCILSLRTQDATTDAASRRLFAVADTPRALLDLPQDELASLIYPVGFYRNKAKSLHAICRALLDGHGGHVPDTIDELLELDGVGRKTANLVVTMGFGKPGICVDTHVHRIMNRLGYIETRTPDATETALRAKLPKRYWIEINDLLVTFGQNLCKPISPLCSQCPIVAHCARVGVERSR